MKRIALALLSALACTQALAAASKDKAGMDAINATGCDVEILPPAQTVERIRIDAAKWGKAAKDANIRAD